LVFVVVVIHTEARHRLASVLVSCVVVANSLFFTMAVYTATKIQLPLQQEDRFNEPSVYVDDELGGSKLVCSEGRYGFTQTELAMFLQVDRCYVLLRGPEKVPRLVLQDVFQSRVQESKFFVGICAGRPVDQCVARLNKLGFNPVMPTEPRGLRIGSADYLRVGDRYVPVCYKFVKSADIPSMLTTGFLDAAMAYGDVWYNLPAPDYNVKYVSYFSDELGSNETHVSLIGTKEIGLLNASGEKGAATQGAAKQEQDESTRYVIARGGAPLKKLVICSEYHDAARLLKRFVDLPKDVVIQQVKGSVESYVISENCDAAITIVQSGETLKQNDLHEVLKLRKVGLNMWMHIPPRLYQQRDQSQHKLRVAVYQHLNPCFKAVVVDGIDGTGKTTVLQEIVKDKRCHEMLVFDRLPALSNATCFPGAVPEVSDILEAPLTPKNTTVVILEANPEICDRRLKARNIFIRNGDEQLEPYEQKDAQCFFRLRYRQIAALCGFDVVPADCSVAELMQRVNGIIMDGDEQFRVPALPDVTAEFFNRLETRAEGESKLVKKLSNRFDLIRYKPSVYSHKQQRGGFVKGTDHERQKTTLNIMLLLAKAGVPHTYWHICNGYILAERLEQAPPVEVCVKGAHVGTHSHIYHNMAERRDRFGCKLVNAHDMYEEPIVRFDWRNPNHLQPEPGQRLVDMRHTQIHANPLRDAGFDDDAIERIFQAMYPHGVPLGDFAMADELADKFICVKKARVLVKKAFKALSEHFSRMNIRFKDVCFMVVQDGDRLFGEVSQDCGRYEAIDPHVSAFQKCVAKKLPWTTDSACVDKDIWRAGGSSDHVLEKWKRLTFLVDAYVAEHISQWMKELFPQQQQNLQTNH
jgi:ATP phosphoribosyltransferase